MSAFKKLSDMYNSPVELRSALYNMGVLASPVRDGECLAVYYCSKKQRHSPLCDNKVITECNGLVYNYKEKKILVIPQPAFTSNIAADDINVVNQHLLNGLYDILQVNEGTTVNLYWLETESSWRISTARAYDLTDKKRGSMTYKEMLNDILGDSAEKFYKLLNTKHCYTFGFKHENSHPFREGHSKQINKLWFIQSVDLNTHEVNYEFKNDIEINPQPIADVAPQAIKELFPLLSNGLDDFIYTGKVNYGYILRSKDPNKTGAQSNILLESSLLQKIRQLCYHSSLGMVAREMGYDESKYILIVSYLDPNRQILSRKLFPQYIGSFKKLDEITNTLADIISSYNTRGCDSQSSPDKLHTYAANVYRRFHSQYTTQLNKKNMTNLIKTYLLTTEWADVYYNLYT